MLADMWRGCILATILCAGTAWGAVPTFSKDVAPIFFKHCAGCHQPDHIAPMSLLDYQSARPWARAVREAVLRKSMPPWFAESERGHFSNDSRLTEEEITTVKAWVDGGAPEGDKRALPRAPEFRDGWLLGKPDVVVDIGEDHEVKPGADAYEHFIVPSDLKDGIWVRAAEIKPGNRRVVHHVHVVIEDERQPTVSTEGMPDLERFLIREGNITRVKADAPVVNNGCAADAPNLPYLRGFQEGGLAAFLPGRPPDVFPEGTAKWVPAGARLRFIIHYAKVDGEPQTDRTSIGLYLAPGRPRQELRRMDLRNFFFQVPAGDGAQAVTRCYTFEREKDLISFTPHMHYRGKEVTYALTRPDGRREVLLRIPRYDFDWQLVYRLARPVRVEKGSVLKVTFIYDNSVNNKSNPDPEQALRWGDKSEEEMFTNWIEYVDAGEPAGSAGSARLR
ncbi:MAG: cytochrome c [Bryobacteraceae bacterium]